MKQDKQNLEELLKASDQFLKWWRVFDGEEVYQECLEGSKELKTLLSAVEKAKQEDNV